MHGHENKHGLVIKAHTGGIRRERGDRGDRALGREVGAGSCSWPLLRCVTWSKSHLLSVPFLSGCQVGGWPCPSSQAGRKAGSALFPMSQPPGSRGEGSACSWDTGTAPVPGSGQAQEGAVPCHRNRTEAQRSWMLFQRPVAELEWECWPKASPPRLLERGGQCHRCQLCFCVVTCSLPAPEVPKKQQKPSERPDVLTGRL